MADGDSASHLFEPHYRGREAKFPRHAWDGNPLAVPSDLVDALLPSDTRAVPTCNLPARRLDAYLRRAGAERPLRQIGAEPAHDKRRDVAGSV